MKVDYKFRQIVVEDGDTGDELIELIKEYNLGKFAIIFKKETKNKYIPSPTDHIDLYPRTPINDPTLTSDFREHHTI